MTTTTITNQLFEDVEYYPTQIDLNPNLFRFYKQLQLNPENYDSFKACYIDETIVNRDALSAFATSSIFKFRKFPQDILNQPDESRLNILNAFKLYLMLQENLKRDVVFSESLLKTYAKLDTYFD